MQTTSKNNSSCVAHKCTSPSLITFELRKGTTTTMHLDVSSLSSDKQFSNGSKRNNWSNVSQYNLTGSCCTLHVWMKTNTMHLNFFHLNDSVKISFFQFELIVVAFSLDHIMSKNVEQQSYGFKQIFPSIGWTLGPALEGLHPHEIKMTVVQFNKIWFVKLQAWPLVFDLNVADTIVEKVFEKCW